MLGEQEFDDGIECFGDLIHYSQSKLEVVYAINTRFMEEWI